MNTEQLTLNELIDFIVSAEDAINAYECSTRCKYGYLKTEPNELCGCGAKDMKANALALLKRIQLTYPTLK